MKPLLAGLAFGVAVGVILNAIYSELLAWEGFFGGIPTLLELRVEASAPAAKCNDGPIPVRALVEGSDEEIEGEVLLWVRDGYLSGLEFAWFTDDAPTRMPTAESIRT